MSLGFCNIHCKSTKTQKSGTRNSPERGKKDHSYSSPIFNNRNSLDDSSVNRKDIKERNRYKGNTTHKEKKQDKEGKGR